MAKSKVTYSKKDVLDEDEFSPKNTKVRITTFIDFDVLVEIKKQASGAGIKYQTYLNQKLREMLVTENILKLDIARIMERLDNIEKKVGWEIET